MNAGGGEVEFETDCGVREPLDVLLGMSPIALSRLSNMGFLVFTAPLPSPRLCVNTFKQTLRGGISLLFLGNVSSFPGQLGWV